MAGGVVDQPVPPDGPPAARFAHLKRLMSQDHTFGWDEWSFAQTSNAIVRRAAFEEVGGFRENIRAAEDADLTYRLKAAGWEVERREPARVVHLSRSSTRRFLAQKVLHGAGGAWLNRQYPGSVPVQRWPGLLWWAMRHAVGGLAAGAFRRDRDRAIRAVFDPLEAISYEIGRLRGNECRDGD
jgi:GT2 family glycosyltransferase